MMDVIQTYEKEGASIKGAYCIDILGDDGQPLFTLQLLDNGHLEVSSGHTSKHGGVVLDSGLKVAPRYSNVVRISRDRYEP